jgi:hypothetical protein
VALAEHTAWLYRAQFRTWPEWIVGAHLFVYAVLLAIATVAYSAETRITTRQLEEIGPAGMIPELYRYRIEQLERHMEESSSERKWIIALLISNLVALAASMATFIIKSKLDDRDQP